MRCQTSGPLAALEMLAWAARTGQGQDQQRVRWAAEAIERGAWWPEIAAALGVDEPTARRALWPGVLSWLGVAYLRRLGVDARW